MFKSGVAVLGVKQIQMAMSILCGAAERNLVRAGNNAALLIEREAINLVSTGPLKAVDTGLMRASTKAHPAEEIGVLHWQWRIGVHPGYTAPGAWVSPTTGQKRVRPFYVLFVHEGTSTMAKRPYIRQAMVNKKDEVERMFGDSVKMAIHMAEWSSRG